MKSVNSMFSAVASRSIDMTLSLTSLFLWSRPCDHATFPSSYDYCPSASIFYSYFKKLNTCYHKIFCISVLFQLWTLDISFSDISVGNESACNAGDTGSISWRRERLPTPVLWPGEFHGLYSPWGCTESDTIELVN